MTKLLLLALLVQVALTFGLLLWLGAVRVTLITGRKIPMRDIAINRDGWPEKAKQLSNAFDNQFQLPVLFYVAVVLTLLNGAATWLELVLGWLFVALRAWHALIHTTNNHVARRFGVYTAGMIVLIVYWVVLGIKLMVL